MLTERGIRAVEVAGKVPRDWADRWEQRGLVAGWEQGTVAGLAVLVSVLRVPFPPCCAALLFAGTAFSSDCSVPFVFLPEQSCCFHIADIAACASSFPLCRGDNGDKHLLSRQGLGLVFLQGAVPCCLQSSWDVREHRVPFVLQPWR